MTKLDRWTNFTAENGRLEWYEGWVGSLYVRTDYICKSFRRLGGVFIQTVSGDTYKLGKGYY